MKTVILGIALIVLLLLGSGDLRAQVYDPYYYWDGSQYVMYAPQDYDPYYELHVLHYQLYLPQYQPYQIYQPCCFVGGAGIPGRPILINPVPQGTVRARAQVIRRR